MKNPNDDLIDDARRAGQAYVNTFGGDLAAVCADLQRRAAAEGRAVPDRKALPPHRWQVGGAPLVRKAV